MGTTLDGVVLLRLRTALMSLASPGQATRHHAPTGLLGRSCRTLEQVAAQLPHLESAGVVDRTQAAAWRRSPRLSPPSIRLGGPDPGRTRLTA